MLRSKSIVAGYAAACVLFLAVGPAWALESGKVAQAAPRSAQTTTTETAQVASAPTCEDRRQQLQAKIDQFRQRCSAQLDSGQVSACDAEQRRVIQDVGGYNSHCGR